ncbi:hypothetical protein LAZ67_15001350 [Cordylochernes scorpioides]|uniref:Retrotransposon gag domain-containing protein n=1 Tax=Cordylochernes scorpioides TaxID=51811 RepID=A0ABY6LDG2_9ARAC|nr:hypothetical protein LAZ67_15001350 [Cordylochernes scorpioides]
MDLYLIGEDKIVRDAKRLAPGFHRRVKAKTSFQYDDVPIDDDTTTKPLFTPQENGRKGTRDNVQRLRWNPLQKHVRSMIFQGLISTLQLVKKLDRYPFRKKRKIDSVEQEETTRNIKKEATNQVGSFFIQHLPRNPSMFSGEGAEDPHNWLKKYERVAKHNQWDETLCLANVYFYLTGTALKWFENNEESILTWKEFMSQLKSAFGKKRKLEVTSR